MERFGFIHEKLDIKILILFVLARLPDALDKEHLADLILFDGGIGYFDFSDCLSELVDTDHVQEDNNYYRITEKGLRNGGIIENSLPFSVRTKAQELLAPVAAKMQRNAMIHTSHKTEDKGCIVSLSLSDGVGEIISINLLAVDDEQAKQMETKFRANAESLYHRIIGMLSE